MDGILSFSLHDKHAQYVRGDALRKLERNIEAYAAFKKLKESNKASTLDMQCLYGDADLPMPKGSPKSVELDEILFYLTPHWDNLTIELAALADDIENRSGFKLIVNKSRFRKSEYKENDTPVKIEACLPDGHPRWVSFFWIDEGEIAQINEGAPIPNEFIDDMKSGWPYQLQAPEGDVTIVGFASTNKELVDFSDIDIAFENALTREKIEEDQDKDAIKKLEDLIALIKESAATGSLIGAVERFKIEQ